MLCFSNTHYSCCPPHLFLTTFSALLAITSLHGPMTHNQPGSNMAAQACFPCRKQKRKCDKMQPKCSLCRRLCRDCSYSSLSEDDASTDIILRSRSAQLSLFSPASIHEKITRQALELMGGEMGIRDCSSEYFRTIHTWFPVVSRSQYLQRLAPIWHEPKAEHSLLSMCMLLLVTCPTESGMTSDMQSLYTLVKGSISLLDAACATSLEVLQCRLLVNLFELGHAMHPTAYISISTNVTIGEALGIHDRAETQSLKDTHSLATNEEAARIWQGILIIDRFLCTDSSRTSCVTKGLFSVQTLPITTKSMNCRSHLVAGSTSVSPHVYYLSSLTEASRLLEQALTHVYNPTLRRDFDADEAIQTIKTLMSFKDFLAEHETKLEIHYTAVIGICNSALLSVYEHRDLLKTPQNHNCPPSSVLCLQHLIEEVVSISRQFQVDAASTKISDIPPFVLHSMYKAAVIVSHGVGGTANMDCEQVLNSLKDMLHCASRRWQIGRYYLQKLADLNKPQVG